MVWTTTPLMRGRVTSTSRIVFKYPCALAMKKASGYAMIVQITAESKLSHNVRPITTA